MSLLRGDLGLLLTGMALLFAGPAAAQDVAPQMECMRNLQTYERGLQVPQGLATAVSLVETGRPIGPNGQKLPWPWTINVNGQGHFFDTKEQAVAETRKLVDSGQRSIDVGCMQVNLRYHPTAFRTLEEAFDPATNVAYGIKFLASLHTVQGSWEKAVERYHSSDDGRREDYRDKVMAMWNGDVRSLVMDAVLAEDTNTPYHHALNAFAAGQYSDALEKYQAILASAPGDRLGLLGVAMTYEKMGQDADAEAAYGRYIVSDPDDAAVLTGLIKKAKALPAADARAKLEALAKAGVTNGELFASLAEMTGAAGDNATAFTYAEKAVNAEPAIVQYRLNAGIFADKLKKSAQAVKYYEDFLASAERQPALVETSLTGIRSRVAFLRAQM